MWLRRTGRERIRTEMETIELVGSSTIENRPIVYRNAYGDGAGADYRTGGKQYYGKQTYCFYKWCWLRLYIELVGTVP